MGGYDIWAPVTSAGITKQKQRADPPLDSWQGTLKGYLMSQSAQEEAEAEAKRADEAALATPQPLTPKP